MRLSILIVGLLAILSVPKISFAEAATPVNPVQVVEVMESTGKHPGFRRNHAKGICFDAEFKAMKEAKALSKAFIFSGKPIPVVGRFSNPGSNPESNDTGTMPRGMALRFQGPEGQALNMSMLNVPVFAVSTPDAFLELLQLKSPEEIGAFQKKHPQSAKFFEFVGGHPAPESFATENYHSLHAFKFTNASGKSQFVRWNFNVEGGEKYLSAADLKTKDKDFLYKEIVERVKSKPTWTMEAVLAQKGDSLVDPSKEWKGKRKKVVLGQLTISAAKKDGPCVNTNFDPNQLDTGIEASDDPVLKFRSPAYAISFGKRMSEGPPPAK